jgi:hypothetical protein
MNIPAVIIFAVFSVAVSVVIFSAVNAVNSYILLRVQRKNADKIAAAKYAEKQERIRNESGSKFPAKLSRIVNFSTNDPEIIWLKINKNNFYKLAFPPENREKWLN